WSGAWSCGYNLYWFTIWAWNWCGCSLSSRALGTGRNHRLTGAFWSCRHNKFIYFAVRSSLSSRSCSWASWFYMDWFTVGSRNGSWCSKRTLGDDEFFRFAIGTCHCSWSGAWSCGYDLYWFTIWAWNWCGCSLSFRALGTERKQRLTGSLWAFRSCWYN
ncbi:unnamed protein product, partial [Larinioides sclopetarius]